jgi:hypothetical protein
MIFFSCLLLAWTWAVCILGLSLPRDDINVDDLNSEALSVLKGQESNFLIRGDAGIHGYRCTLTNAIRRRDW